MRMISSLFYSWRGARLRAREMSAVSKAKIYKWVPKHTCAEELNMQCLHFHDRASRVFYFLLQNTENRLSGVPIPWEVSTELVHFHSAVMA